MLQGRFFTEADRDKAPLVAIVNQAFADEFFPGQNPIGKQIDLGSRQNRWREIVGVVGNVNQQGKKRFDRLAVYGALQESFQFETFLILKSDSPPEHLVSATTKTIHSIDPNEPVFDAATMETLLGKSLSGPLSTMLLMSLFAGTALLLASVGLFGVIAYFVNRRTQEIGIRMALGATPADVLHLVLNQGMILVIIGISIGIGGAIALARTAESLIEGTRTNDPATIAIVAVTFLLIGTGACLIPARWATKVDPAISLRQG